MSERQLAIDALLQQLETGGIDALRKFTAVAAPHWREETLRRCALLPTFSFADYEAVRASSPEPLAAFEEVIAWPEIEAVPRTARFRVRDRAATIKTWSGPATSAERAEARAAYRSLLGHVRLDDLPPVERSELVIRAAAPEAAVVLTHACWGADDRDDLPLMNDILVAATAAADPGDGALQVAVADLRTYYEGRVHWNDDTQRAKLYIERQHLTDTFEGLLSPTAKKWVLDIHAMGGMGKTVALRTLIARRCVPRQFRVPVAKIDFDFVAVRTATDAMLLIANIAEQFNRQMTNAPFDGIVRDLESYVLSAAAANIGLGAIRGSELEMIKRFGNVLTSNRPQGDPVLLVFDTVEIPLLHHQPEMVRILSIVAALHAATPALRVVMAGRYSLAHKLGTLGVLKRQVRQIRLCPFDDLEAANYLTSRRDVPPGEALDAIVRKCAGLPFKLALFGDILRTGPLTVAQIESYSDDSIAYLVERVLERLKKDDEKPLQWVLRYGAIPRKLSFSFLEEVALPFIRAGMAGQPRADDPFTGLPPAVRSRLFPQDLLGSPDAPVNVRVLWDRLRQYAGAHSWISIDATRSDTLVLHSEVVDPMRMLLGDNDVFRLLHEQAIRYYGERAKDDETTDSIRESLYHSFQIGTEGAASRWRALIDSSFRAGELNRAAEIAREIIGPEYLRDLEPLLRRSDGQPVAPPELIAEAFTIDGRLRLRSAWAGLDPQAWEDAAIAFSKARTLAATAGQPASPELRIAWAAVLAHGSAPEALADIDQAMTDPRLELSRLVVVAHLHQSQRDAAAAVRAWSEAKRVARTLGLFVYRDPPPLLLEWDSCNIEQAIVFDLAEQQSRLGKYDAAMDELAELRSVGRRRRNLALVDSCRLRLASIWLELLEPAAALRQIDSVGQDEASTNAMAAILRAEARRQLFQAKLAHDAARLAVSLVETMRDSSADGLRIARLAAAANTTLGRVLTDLFIVEGARIAFGRAMTEIAALNDPTLLAPIVAEAAERDLDQFGPSDYVVDSLARLRRLAESSVPEFGTRVDYLMRRLESMQSLSVQASWRAIGSQPSTPQERALRETVALMSPADQRDPSAGAAGDRLAVALAEITPPRARLHLLKRLSSVSSGRAADNYAAIAQLLPRRWGLPELQRIAVADGLRVFGEPDRARKMLHYFPGFLPVDPLLVRAIDGAARRLGLDSRHSPTRRRLHFRRELLAWFPALIAMTYIDHAEQFADDQRFALELLSLEAFVKVEGGAATIVSRRRGQVRERLRPRFEAPTSSASDLQTQSLFTVTIDRGNSWGRVWLHVRTPSGIEQNFTIEDLPLSDVPVRGGEAASYGWASQFGNGRAFVEVLQRRLLATLYPVIRDSSKIRLVINDRESHQFPWELGFVNGRSSLPLRRISRCSRSADETPPRGVVEISSILAVVRGRDSKQVAYHLVDESHERVYRNTKRFTFGQYFEDIRPRNDSAGIVHLCVPFQERSREGSVFAVFSSMRSRGGDIAVSAKELGGEFYAYGMPPIIVLDPPRGGSPTETVVQMQLRNTFAAELFSMGSVSAVLATGLFDAETLEWAVDSLTDGFASRGEIASLLPPRFCKNAVPTGAIALFTDDPAMRIDLEQS